MIVSQVVAGRPQLFDRIQGQRLVVDRHPCSRRAKEADGVGTHDHQLQRRLQARIHKANIVHDVGAVKQRRHQADGRLKTALLVKHLGVRGAAQAKDRQPIMLAHLGSHTLFVGKHIVAHHRLEVVRPTVPPRHPHRGSLAHQLRQHDA